MLNIGELLQNVSITPTMSFNEIQDEIRGSLIQMGMLSDQLLKKLGGYKQINNVFELQRGRNIKWLRENAKLTNGAILVDIKFLDSGTHILCKNPTGRMFQVKYDDCVIFQKMTPDEILIAYAVGVGET